MKLSITEEQAAKLKDIMIQLIEYVEADVQHAIDRGGDPEWIEEHQELLANSRESIGIL